MGKNIQSDKMQWELLIKDSQAQREIAKLTQTNKELEKSNKEVRLEMAKLEAQGKKNSTEWNGLRNVLQKNSTEISNNTKLIKANEDQLSTQNMTMQQLKKRYKELELQLNGTSKALDPKAWSETKTKIDETRSAMDEMSGKTKKTEGVLLGWGSAMKIGLMGVLGSLAGKIVSSISEFFSLDKIISSTQATGDKFEATMAGLKNSFNYVRVAVSTMDFSNFTKNLNEAYKVAKEVQENLDELFERENSFKLKKIVVQAEIENLYDIKNNTNLLSKVRKEAADSIIFKTRELDSIETDIAQRRFNDVAQLTRQKTGLNNQQLDYIVKEYLTNDKVLEQARQYLSLQDNITSAKNNYLRLSEKDLTLGKSRLIKMALGDLGSAEAKLKKFELINSKNLEGIKEAAKITKGYEKVSDDVITEYVNAQHSLLSIGVESEKSLRRVKRESFSLDKDLINESLQRKEEVIKLTTEQQEAGYKKETEAAEEAAKKKLIILKESYKNGLITQIAYNSLSASIEDELISDKIKINTIYSKSSVDLQDQLVSNQVQRFDKLKTEYKAIFDEFKKMNEEAEAQFKKTQDEITRIDNDQITEDLDSYSESFDKAVQTASDAIESQKSDLERLQELYDADLAALRNSLDLKLLSQEQYEEAVKRLKEKKWKEKFEFDSEGLKAILELTAQQLSAISQISADIQNLEMSRLEKQKDQEIKLYGNTSAKKTAIEQKYEEAKLKVQKKYADIDMGIKIAQTLAAGALAIIQALGQLGPIAGGIAAGVIGATTAIQVGVIIAQRNAIQNSSVDTSGSGSLTQRTVSESTSNSGRQYSPSVLNIPTAKSPVAATSGVSNIQSLTKETTYRKSEDPDVLSGIAPALEAVNATLKDLQDNPVRAYTVLNEFESKKNMRDRIRRSGSL